MLLVEFFSFVFLFMRCILYEDRELAKRTGKVGRKRGFVFLVRAFSVIDPLCLILCSGFF